LFSSGAGRAVIRSGKQDDEFFPAIAAYHVFGADALHQCQPEFLQYFVSGAMPVGIVELLEMIQIEHNHTQRLLGSCDPPGFAFKKFAQITAIEYAG